MDIHLPHHKEVTKELCWWHLSLQIKKKKKIIKLHSQIASIRHNVAIQPKFLLQAVRSVKFSWKCLLRMLRSLRRLKQIHFLPSGVTRSRCLEVWIPVDCRGWPCELPWTCLVSSVLLNVCPSSVFATSVLHILLSSLMDRSSIMICLFLITCSVCSAFWKMGLIVAFPRTRDVEMAFTLLIDLENKTQL